MDLFNDAIALITHPPGDLVYFLVTLFSLQQALVTAVIARRTSPNDKRIRRWIWAIGFMLVGRAVLILLGLISNAGLISPTLILPPLERWLEIVGVILIIWAAALSEPPIRWQTTIFLILVVAATGYFIYDLITWSTLEAINIAYTATPQAVIWTVGLLTMLILFLFTAIFLRQVEWEWMVGIAFFWLLGSVAQLIWSDPMMHFSGWQRLTALIAIPMVSILVHQQLSGTAKSSPIAPITGTKGLSSIINIAKDIEMARDIEPALMVASSKIAKALTVDMCAILLEDEEDNEIKVVAMHPPNAAQLEPPVIKLSNYASLQKTFITHQASIIDAPEDEKWPSGLYNQLRLPEAGPLAILPLNQKDKNQGLLLLGHPTQKSQWQGDAFDVPVLAAQLTADAIAKAKQQRKQDFKAGLINGQITDNQAVEQIKAKARERIQALKNQITNLTAEIQNRDQRIEQLSKELESYPQESSSTELEFWQNEVKQLAAERDEEAKKSTQLLQDQEILQTERNRLAVELTTLRGRMDILLDEQEELRTQLVNYHTQAAEAQVMDGKGSSSNVIGLVIVDEDGQITMADAPARQMLHLPTGDIVGMPINGAYPDPEWTQTVDAMLSTTPDNQTSDQAHLSLLFGNESVEADISTLRGRDGKPDGLAITLRSSESHAERYEAIVSQASEFRTPMTAITGYTDLLLGEQAGILTPIQQQFLERVKANVEQLNHQLNDLVSIASPDFHPIELSPQPVNLIEIIEEAIMGLAARFRERKLIVQLDLPPELGMVKADRDSLYQIMLRLLSNAVLCSKVGTQIVVSATKTDSAINGENVCISVKDTGEGIAPEDYSRVFRRFVRANQPLVQGMGETGIGMAVAKTLVEANGGRIWVESQKDVGSSFSFILPIQQEDG
jgi:signal transduction histidine kinase